MEKNKAIENLPPPVTELAQEPTVTRKSRLILMIPGFLALLIYILTVSPSISGNDTAELSLAVTNLGIPHAPGFPLYVLIGKVFTTLFPFGEPALRLAILSAICGALCIWILTLIVFKINHSIIIAIATALLWAFTCEFWKVCVVPSVYPLLFLSFILSFYFLVLTYYRKQDKFILLAFLFAFFGVTVHIIFLPYILVVLLFSRYIHPCFFKNSRQYLNLTGIFLLVLNLFLCIPIASGFNPVPDEGNPETFPEVLTHISAVSSLSPITQGLRYWPGIRETFANIGSKIITQWFPSTSFISILLFIFVGFWGIMYFKKQKTPWLMFLFLLIAWSALPSGFVMLFPFPIEANHDIVRIMLPGLLSFVILAGGAMGNIWANTRADWKSLKTWIAFGFILGMPLILGMYNYQKCNRSQWNFPEEHTTALLKSLPDNAILVAHDRPTFYRLYYIQQVSGVGQRMSLIAGRPETRKQGWDEFLVCIKQESKRPLFVTFKNPEEITAKFAFYPQGLAQRVVSTYLGEQPVIISLFIPNFQFPILFHELDLQDQNMVSEYFLTKAMSCLFEEKVDQATEAFEKCIHHPKSVIYLCKRHANWFDKKKLTKEAISLLKYAIFINSDDGEAHRQLGKIYIQAGKYSDAIFHLEKALETRKKDLDTNLELARAYEAIADYSMAVAVYKRIIKWYPNHPAAYKELGTLLIKFKQEEEGKAMIKRAMYLEHLEKLQQQMMPELKPPAMPSPSVPKPEINIPVPGQPEQGKPRDK